MGRSFSRLFAVFLSSTALIGTAYAADLPEPVMPADDWTGFHIGVGGGYGAVNHRLALDTPGFDDLLSFSGIGGEGGLFTVEGGYDYQFSSDFVVGIMGDYTYSGIGTELDVDLGFFDANFTLDASHSFSVLGRLGWLANPDTLIYGLVGWTWTEFEGDLDINGGNVASYSFDLDGLTVGAGIETRFTPNITGKLEYRYTDYQDNSLLGGGGFELYNDTSMQSIRAVASYRFGNPGGYVTPVADYSVASTTNWSGFRLGAGGGYGFINHELSLDVDPGGTLASLDGISGEGGLFTVEVGYDHQFSNNFVAGVQFDYTGSSIETVAELDLGVPGFTGYRLEASDSYTVAGRLGYLVTPDTLAYGLVGWTWTDFEQDILVITGTPVITNDFDADGFTVGAGIETVLAENFTGKLEYRYTDYGKLNVFEIDDDLDLNNDISLQSVRAVVSYKLPIFNQ
ncbi:outer membrane beta-barrel protein [Anderseniella sp. Alg231-50]|uniref:outer membrane beta-barrel protein n=1 Tax=Anderseniella sp. Alg231-50 TaxID=1922226 RepID=UPI000D550A12